MLFTAQVLCKEESKDQPALIHVLQASDFPNLGEEQNERSPHKVPDPKHHLSVTS